MGLGNPKLGTPDLRRAKMPLMTTVIHRNVQAARVGANRSVVCRTRSGWIVMGDRQVLRGYCLLLPDPVVPDLNSLLGADRAQYLEDLASLGDALLEVTGAARINYAILGNLEPALHAHAFPRFPATEPEELRTQTPWAYDWKAAPAFDPEADALLVSEIAEAMRARGAAV